MNYIAVDIRSFRNTLRDISFDIYLKVSEDHYAHVFSKTTGLDYKRLASYMQKGTAELYIKHEDELAYRTFVRHTAESILTDPAASPEKKIAILLNMTEQTMAELFAQVNISEETAESTEKVVKKYVDLLTDSPKSLATLLRLVSHGEYLYYHSVAVSVFSVLVARATGQFNQQMIEMIGLGGFMHDIGCIQISKAILDSPKELTPAEWKEMRSHTKLGLQMIEKTANIPDEVRYIVYQHHEEPSGAGYPNGLKGSAIYYPARIVAIVDTFSALISKRPYRPAFTVEQAIALMQSNPARYERELVGILNSLFGPGRMREGHAA